MTKQTLPKTYDFQATEKRIYEWWEQNGYFKPWKDPNEPGFDPNIESFVISIPPPNVTGELHLGHAMFVAMGFAGNSDDHGSTPRRGWQIRSSLFGGP